MIRGQLGEAVDRAHHRGGRHLAGRPLPAQDPFQRPAVLVALGDPLGVRDLIPGQSGRVRLGRAAGGWRGSVRGGLPGVSRCRTDRGAVRAVRPREPGAGPLGAGAPVPEAPVSAAAPVPVVPGPPDPAAGFPARLARCPDRFWPGRCWLDRCRPSRCGRTASPGGPGRIRRGNPGRGDAGAALPLSAAGPAPSPVRVLTGAAAESARERRARGRGDAGRAGGTGTAPTAGGPRAGGPGLVLPRDRDPPGRGRMYRRTRSMSRSRISRTPSDRVPGCQGMTKQRERHLPLPAVTGYGCHAVTERLLLFTDEPGPAPAKLRACGWSVPYLRCSPWLSGCAGPGCHDAWPGPRAQRPRLPTAGTQRAAGDTLPPMTECHQPRRRCPKTGPRPWARTTIRTSSASSTGLSGVTVSRAETTEGSPARPVTPGLARPAYECRPVMNRLRPAG